eukprot:TRINITY_DN4096_c0_g1_i1.p1 TRINITY_DN4096_c0_g1~~TRINITY_DN4096_c0_g1_i1.p1  ORF type:complete len:256 (-),score=56.94 TRINITY_DN4096_c0_g1_i1:16-783(-)
MDFIHLESLSRITCRNNLLTEFPFVFTQMRQLVNLNLSGNQIVHVPPEIGNLVHLKELNLDNNPKLHEIPETMGELVNLEFLSIEGTSVHSETIPDEVLSLQSCIIVLKYHEVQEIVPGVFLGGENIDLEKGERLREWGITHVLSLIDAPHHNSHWFEYNDIVIKDSSKQDITEYLDETVVWMEQVIGDGGSLFVHCVQGVSRSASFVIAFIMYKMNLDFESAYLTVRNRRPCILPNKGFCAQLKAWGEANGYGQ